MAQKAIIIGATSGIGRELARIMAADGYIVGLTGRRLEMLESLQAELGGNCHIMPMDVARPEEARQGTEALIEQMDGVDIMVINAGIGGRNAAWALEKQILDINVVGFTAIASLAMAYFKERGGGHIVGVSSVAGSAGFGRYAAYASSKAYMSNYLQALRHRARQTGLNIAVTDIRPGFVETPMTEGNTRMFWVAPVDIATRQIYRAIRRRKRIAYITRRWALFGGMFRIMPDWLFIRINAM